MTPTATALATPAHAKARSIMGKNFLGAEEVRRGYGITLDPEEFSEIPFSDETLHACKDTHVLVAGSALSLMEISERTNGVFCNLSSFKDEAYDNNKQVSVRWYLFRKESVPKSCRKTYKRQIALLTTEEEVPFACEVTYMVILYWLTRRERLLSDVYVRCQDKHADGRRICVGGFDSGGFTVSDDWDSNRDELLGLASARKPEILPT